MDIGQEGVGVGVSDWGDRRGVLEERVGWVGGSSSSPSSWLPSYCGIILCLRPMWIFSPPLEAEV